VRSAESRDSGVAAAVAEADLVAAGDEGVAVRAAGRRVCEPLPGRRLYQLAQHK
jgi:hypothetical protein